MTIIEVTDDAPLREDSRTPLTLSSAAGDDHMTWTKLGDEWPESARDLSDAAYRTHSEALCWSNRRLLDLVIERRDLKRFAETPDPAAAVAELVRKGWWQEIPDGWFIGCYFPEWQRDRVQVEHERTRKAADQRRKRRHDLDDHSLCIVGRCKALPAPSPGDKPGDGSGDPGRDGTGRDRTGREMKEETPKQLGQCRVCDHREPLLPDGRCEPCTAWEWEEAS